VSANSRESVDLPINNPFNPKRQVAKRGKSDYSTNKIVPVFISNVEEENSDSSRQQYYQGTYSLKLSPYIYFSFPLVPH
jgi:hypothetical protein